MKRILVAGYNGEMGKNICRMINKMSDMEIACGIHIGLSIHPICGFPVFSQRILEKDENGLGKIDAIIDVSSSTPLTENLLAFSEKNAIPIVITGLHDDILNYMKKVSKKVPVFYSVDISDKMGIIKRLIEVLAEYLPDSEIVITENLSTRGNIQLSNCTVNMLKETAVKAIEGKEERKVTTSLSNNHISISNIFAENTCGSTYTISFNGENSDLQVTYTTHSEDAFTEGAINALNFILQEGRKPRFYSVEDLF